MNILWVGDSSATFTGECLRLTLESRHISLIAATAGEASAQVGSERVDCVCAIPGGGAWNAMDLLRSLRSLRPAMPIVFYDPQVSISQSMHLGSAGAVHVTETLSPDRLVRLLSDAGQERRRTPVAEVPRAGAASQLIGESRAMNAVRDIISIVANRKTTVLITGETGTGKELAAKAIHNASQRSTRGMVSVNCAALPENLLEAELFGHTRGAFTGAVTSRVGRFEQAQQSTIFLDEVGEMPLEVQAKLLRVLQERELQRLGSSDTIQLDVRVLAASNIDMRKAVAERRFREDLMYRLRVVELRMPPLRERFDDIPVLVDYFIEKVCGREELPVKRIDPGVLDHLRGYHWPGNVRELEHVVEAAVVLSDTRSLLVADDFELPINECALDAVPEPIDLPESGIDFERVVARIETNLLTQALRKAGGNKARAADMLGIPRTTFGSKVKALRYA